MKKRRKSNKNNEKKMKKWQKWWNKLNWRRTVAHLASVKSNISAGCYSIQQQLLFFSCTCLTILPCTYDVRARSQFNQHLIRKWWKKYKLLKWHIFKLFLALLFEIRENYYDFRYFMIFCIINLLKSSPAMFRVFERGLLQCFLQLRDWLEV